MTDYWKSLPRKFCEFCKCWITDNKPSIEFHERGKRHQENVEKKIGELRKKGQKDYEAKKKLENELRKMNEAAIKALEKDIERNPALAKELEREKLRNPPPVAQPPATNKKGKSKKQDDSESNEEKVYVWKQPHKRKSQTSSASKGNVEPKPTPYGKWIAIDVCQTEVIDLQLPVQKETTSYKVVATSDEPEITFNEKPLTTSIISSSETQVVTFKKRKVLSDTKRNMRRRLDDDDD